MERLDFSENTAYSAVEACIHLNRYAFVKPFCEGACILDAACGQGYGSYLMKTWGAKEVTGIDIDAGAVEQAANLFQEEGLRYLQQTVEQLPFEDNSFDMVVSFETIEHVNYPEAFLEEIKRVLKPGGTVILSCPNDNYYYQNDCAKNPFHKEEYTYFQFKELAEKHLGQDAEYFFSFALDGFINLPFDKLTEPDKHKQEDALGLFHHEVCSSALCVPQERYLNMWNANYYIGIWGARENCYRISTVLTPRETFIEHKDKDFDFIHHVEKLQNKVQSMNDGWQILENRLLQAYHNRDLLERQMEERTKAYAEQVSQLQCQIEAQKAQYDEYLKNLTGELQNRLETREQENLTLAQSLEIAQTARETLQQQADGLSMSNARLTELLDLTRKEQDQLKKYADEQIRVREQVCETLEATRTDLKLLRKDYALLQQELHGQQMAAARMTELLELTKRERNQLQEYAQVLSGQVAYVQGERDWLRGRWESLFFIRAKRLLTRIIGKAKRILGKGN